MRDADVRTAVRRMLHDQYGDESDTRIVEEMGIWAGSARIDVAVINGQLIGYELKSDRDSLDRLPGQIALYNRVFDKVSLVVGAKHVRNARLLIPRWWGIVVAYSTANGVKLRNGRRARANPAPDAMTVAQLLWRDEALAILEKRGGARGWRSKTASQLHAHLATTLSFADLGAEVRGALRLRRGWLRQLTHHQAEMPVDSDLDPSLTTP